MKTAAAAAFRSSAFAAGAVGLMFAAVPACAQSVLVTATATAPALTQGAGKLRAQSATRGPRALTRAVFARPRAAEPSESPAPGKLTISTAATAPDIKPKDEWISDQGFSFTGARIGYKARF